MLTTLAADLLRRALRPATVIAALATVLTGQELTQLPTTPIHTTADDFGESYGTWATGGHYKASFHDGAVFVPYLGSDYPHNQPWRWHTVSAHVGDHSLLDGDPALSYRDTRAEYDLGQIVEAYDVLPAGLEQTFVIANARSTGDLVITGKVHSQLTADEVAAAHQSLTFRDSMDRAIVTYGRATAIDANGRTFAMTTEHADGLITLRLPAADLANARMPLVVDPLIAGASTITDLLVKEMHVVRDSENPTGGTWTSIIVVASATDTDLLMYRWAEDGTFLANVYADVTVNWETNGGSLAYNAASNYVVCVFDRTTAAGIRRLRFHRHHRTSSTFSNGYQLINSTDSSWRADVGGTAQGFAGTEVLVVWQQEPNAGPFAETNSSSIYGCSINTLGNTAGAPFVISGGLFSDADRPCINQVSAGSINNSWLVAYQTRTTIVGNDDWDIAVREVDTAGSVSAPTYVDNSSPEHKLGPKIAGSNGRYLVAYTEASLSAGLPTSIFGHDIHAVRLDWPLGAGAGTEPHPRATFSSLVSQQVAHDVAYNRNTRSHWALTTRTTLSSTARLRILGHRGQAVDSDTIASPSYVAQQVLEAPVSFHAAAGEFVGLRWKSGYSQFGAPPVSSSLQIYRYEYVNLTPPTTVGTSCSPAAIGWSGSTLVGSEFGAVTINGAAVDSLHLMALSLAPSSLPLTGIPPFASGCWLNISSVSPDFLGLFPLQIGSSPTFPLPLPETLLPTVLHLQDLHSVGNGNLDFVTTARLEVTIGI